MLRTPKLVWGRYTTPSTRPFAKKALKCPTDATPCLTCSCTGKQCQLFFPGLKVEWPEIKGRSAQEAMRIIENDNHQFVTTFIFPDKYLQLEIMGCNRVFLITPKNEGPLVFLVTPKNECPNGPVLDSPQIGSALQEPYFTLRVLK